MIIFQDEPRGPSCLVEVLVDDDGEQRVKFDPQDQLKSDPTQLVIIKSIRLVTEDVLVRGMLNDAPTAPNTELQKLTVTIYCDGWEKGFQIPVLTLNDMALSGGTAPHRYQQTNLDNWKGVSWEKTHLDFAAGTVSAGSPYVVLFDVQYVKVTMLPNGSYQEIQGPS